MVELDLAVKSASDVNSLFSLLAEVLLLEMAGNTFEMNGSNVYSLLDDSEVE